MLSLNRHDIEHSSNPNTLSDGENDDQFDWLKDDWLVEKLFIDWLQDNWLMEKQLTDWNMITWFDGFIERYLIDRKMTYWQKND